MSNYMDKKEKIYVAGHLGLVGSSIVRKLKADGYINLLLRTHQELDLTNQFLVNEFFTKEKPAFVLLAAAKVGGIVANNDYSADFGYQNQAIQNNIIHAAWKNKIKRLMFIGSSCVYPRDCPQPMREEHLLSGYLEPTNKAYALAKLSGISLCESFNKQYGTQYIAAMPTNLYGPNDNYDLETSHVIPALMRKIHEAKTFNKDFVEVWGTGKAEREFMHSDDLAEALLFLMNLGEIEISKLLSCPISGPVINIGYGKDISIEALVNLLCEIVGFKGGIKWNTTIPDGTPKKLLNCEKIHKHGWRAKKELKAGLEKIYQEKFMEQQLIGHV